MPAPSASHQTITYLQRRFADAGVHVKARWGQNFLIDLNLQRLLLDTAAVDRDDVVLEVGAGTGALTLLLAERAGSVVSFEIDSQMHQLATETVHGFDNVRLLHGDALLSKHVLSPDLLAAIECELAAAPTRRWKLVANLPYCIATPLIATLLSLESPPGTMTVTVQLELAERFMAAPGSKDYSALSIWLQSQCEIELVRALPPSVFWPRPKVDSAIVQLRFDPAKRVRIRDRHFFQEFVRELFCHRRKLLRGQLQLASQKQLTATAVDRILAEQRLSSTARAEQLSVEEMIALVEAVQDSVSPV